MPLKSIGFHKQAIVYFKEEQELNKRRENKDASNSTKAGQSELYNRLFVLIKKESRKKKRKSQKLYLSNINMSFVA